MPQYPPNAILPMLYLPETNLLKEGTEDMHHVVDDIKGRYSRLNDTVNEILQVAIYL